MLMAACVSSAKPAYLISLQVEITVVTLVTSLLQIATLWVARFLVTDPACSWRNKQ